MKFFLLFLVGVGHIPKSLKKIKHKKVYLNDENYPILHYRRFISSKLGIYEKYHSVENLINISMFGNIYKDSQAHTS